MCQGLPIAAANTAPIWREGRREREELPVAFISSQYHKHLCVAMVIAVHF